MVLSLAVPLRAVLKLGWPTWSEMVRHSFRLLLVRQWLLRLVVCPSPVSPRLFMVCLSPVGLVVGLSLGSLVVSLLPH